MQIGKKCNFPCHIIIIVGRFQSYKWEIEYLASLELAQVNIRLNILQLHTYPENIRIYLFTEYAYLWELQTLLPAKWCI
jgi:hypothetical protein